MSETLIAVTGQTCILCGALPRGVGKLSSPDFLQQVGDPCSGEIMICKAYNHPRSAIVASISDYYFELNAM